MGEISAHTQNSEVYSRTSYFSLLLFFYLLAHITGRFEVQSSSIIFIIFTGTEHEDSKFKVVVLSPFLLAQGDGRRATDGLTL